MGAKVVVIDAANESAVLGHIEDEAVRFAGGRGTIVGRAALQLKEMLGQGYGRRRFHLLMPACRLDGCRVVAPGVVFTYEHHQLLDADEAPPTYPEHAYPEHVHQEHTADFLVDEETPTDSDRA